MKLENQVCGLEYAKRLCELGVKQDSLFYWTLGGVVYRSEMPFWIDTNYAAFTASELGQILPIHVTLKEDEPFNNFRLFITTFLLHVGDEFKKSYIVNYECDTQSLDNIFKNYLGKNKHDTNLANAMAKMLIHLIENKLIEAPQ